MSLRWLENVAYLLQINEVCHHRDQYLSQWICMLTEIQLIENLWYSRLHSACLVTNIIHPITFVQLLNAILTRMIWETNIAVMGCTIPRAIAKKQPNIFTGNKAGFMRNILLSDTLGNSLFFCRRKTHFFKLLL